MHVLCRFLLLLSIRGWDKYFVVILFTYGEVMKPVFKN